MSDRGPRTGRLRRAVGVGTVAVLVAALDLSAAPPGHADPVPAPYTANAHADLVELRAEVLGNPLTKISVGHALVRTDSTGWATTLRSQVAAPPNSARVVAEGATADVTVGAATLLPDRDGAFAPTPRDPPRESLLSLDLGPLAGVEALTTDVSADYLSDGSCPNPIGSVRRLGRLSRGQARRQRRPRPRRRCRVWTSGVDQCPIRASVIGSDHRSTSLAAPPESPRGRPGDRQVGCARAAALVVRRAPGAGASYRRPVGARQGVGRRLRGRRQHFCPPRPRLVGVVRRRAGLLDEHDEGDEGVEAGRDRRTDCGAVRLPHRTLHRRSLY